VQAAYKSVPATLAAVLEGEHLQDCGRVLALWLVLMKRFGDRPADMLAAARALVPPYQPTRGVVLSTVNAKPAAAFRAHRGDVVVAAGSPRVGGAARRRAARRALPHGGVPRCRP
jgi:hypothetical protein